MQNGVNTTEIAPGARSPNYMTAVPQTTVFLNMLADVQPDLNISSNVLVLHDETLRAFVALEWLSTNKVSVQVAPIKCGRRCWRGCRCSCVTWRCARTTR